MASPERNEREIRQLSHDLAKGLAGLRYMVEANTGRIKRLEDHDVAVKLATMETRLRAIEEASGAAPVRLAVLEEKVRDLADANKEHTGKIETLTVNDAKDIVKTEKTKAQWGLWAAIGVAVVSALASLAVQLLKALGVG